MSTQVTICKKPSGHNLQVTVKNPGNPTPTVQTLQDNQFTEVLVYGDGSIELHEVEKTPAQTAA